MTEAEVKTKLAKKGLSSEDIEAIIKKCCEDGCDKKCINVELEKLGYSPMIATESHRDIKFP